MTMAELAAATPPATSVNGLGVRTARNAEAVVDPRPVDVEAARAYGRVAAAIVASRSTARGARAVDLLIAATAYAAQLPLYTNNAEDFRGLEGLVEVIGL